ncbi:hypothetical protein FVEG_14070 [Fusarium verticillioides 7600]|uniref:Uncharacterized protein n=1 Tax=Gibberella moniliformis (strain M3125 / FGSC 7600) TaxID=334819 RepID=W7MX84_GIBM7|nr:hypothetical protein FVEG_14070 [Fusarium verticillioides 7600]EWG55966.1 hypothetical protein FVEG_14070 [Fusarium verticillioides 7600]RBR05315.1 hypothetical protein FVER53590_14070 [Fusarium verticillioides]
MDSFAVDLLNGLAASEEQGRNSARKSIQALEDDLRQVAQDINNLGHARTILINNFSQVKSQAEFDVFRAEYEAVRVSLQERRETRHLMMIKLDAQGRIYEAAYGAYLSIDQTGSG